MRGRLAPFILGVGLLGLALFMPIFGFYALALEEDAGGFFVTLLVAGLCGAVLVRVGRPQVRPSRREALISVLFLWLLIPAFGAIPFMASGGMSPLNAFFESMSGFTTTGATVLRDFDQFSTSLFMWRSLTQWLGGVGIIVLFIAVLPELAIAGRQLFFAEATGPIKERLTPRLRSTSNAILNCLYGSYSCLRACLRSRRYVYLRRSRPRLYDPCRWRVQSKPP